MAALVMIRVSSRRAAVRAAETWTTDGGGVWRSLVAHLLWEQGVGGSNPSTPTIFRAREGAR